MYEIKSKSYVFVACQYCLVSTIWKYSIIPISRIKHTQNTLKIAKCEKIIIINDKQTLKLKLLQQTNKWGRTCKK